MAALVRAGKEAALIDPDNYHHIHAAFAQSATTMKAVVKLEILWVLVEQMSVEHKVRKLQRDMDDDAELSRLAKTYFMGKLKGAAEGCSGRRNGQHRVVTVLPT